MTKEEDLHFKRVMSLIRPEDLTGRRVLIVGAGSLGAPNCVELARLGIEQSIIDLPGERLERHNIIRHALPLDLLGQNKAHAIADWAKRFHPSVEIHDVALDVVAQGQEFLDFLGSWKPDLVLVTTDNEPSRHAVNHACFAAGIPMVMGGVFDGGMGGMIVVSRPNGPCYGCISAFLGSPEASKPHLVIDYNTEDLNDVQTTAALNLDIMMIAMIQAKVAVSLLLHGDLSMLGVGPRDAQVINAILFSNRKETKFHPEFFRQPFLATFLAVNRGEGCFVCGDVKSRSLAATSES